MKKNITIAILTIAVIALALLYALERFKREITEEEYLNISLQHLAAGAMETIWIRSEQKESYFFLMECTFESLPEIIEASEGLDLNDYLLENTKEMIAHYYVLSGYNPTKTLTDFLGDYLEENYEPYKGFDLPDTREEVLEMIETKRTEL